MKYLKAIAPLFVILWASQPIEACSVWSQLRNLRSAAHDSLERNKARRLNIILDELPSDQARLFAMTKFSRAINAVVDKQGPIWGIIEAFKSSLLIPPNGKILIIGPADNFYEWVVPMLMRPDILVMVSDRKPSLLSYMIGVSEISSSSMDVHFETHAQKVKLTQKEIFDAIQRNNPQLLAASPHVNDLDSFRQAIEKQVWLIGEVPLPVLDPKTPSTKIPFLRETPVPAVDLVMSFLPQYYRRVFDHLKENGLIWVTTENAERRLPILDYCTRVLLTKRSHTYDQKAVKQNRMWFFLPGPSIRFTDHSPGVFTGRDIADVAYLALPPRPGDHGNVTEEADPPDSR